MPEIEEVFRLATNKVKPEPQALERQILRQRTAERTNRARVYTLIAAVLAVFAVIAFVTTNRHGEKVKPLNHSPSVTQTLPPGVSPQTTEVINLQGRVVATSVLGSPQYPQDAFSLSLTPDSQTITFVTDPGGIGSPNQIGIISSDGTGMRVLSTPGLDVGSTAIAPDGSKVAFEATAQGNTDIYVVGIDGSGLTRLTSDPSIDQYP